ncbi:hypothetical protein M441DRAFT_240196 [Trichoderma asperellum CBS 433.97]|uniref:Uncharacterized protein n=1 Tax=Trichoderma asperellum (strain ATCC 204424 / CBS 433.97 / NBRC 101777) TaxID=1042311 RepID=A0A2T3Z216_TRIA4|nr:hypothetical protein M441DRAFT_240196 [Trichoderma asperellum CBS 433.97]PTB38858.1 hypothetical protein M441DRAFT_240196 [Trichoderma asperellum CBS 433.97]
MSNVANATRPATSPKTVPMEAAELVATVARKATFPRIVTSPGTWTLLSAATARKLDTTVKSAPSLETGPKSNVPTVRSMDIPKSAASSHPKIRKLLQARTSVLQVNSRHRLIATLTIATPTMRVATEAMEALGNSFPKCSIPETLDLKDLAFYSNYRWP